MFTIYLLEHEFILLENTILFFFEHEKLEKNEKPTGQNLA